MLKTFKIGGVHPPENKLSAGNPIEVLPLPKTVFIPVSQHIGAPAVPLVKKGDDVKVGQLIAKSSSFVSTNIHSSVSGKVKRVDFLADSSGYPKQGIFIDVEGDEWLDNIDRHAIFLKRILKMTVQQLLKNSGCRNCGTWWCNVSNTCETGSSQRNES
jgi:Na+-translocating ferredoxin:NAD+ oxidoreductase subunit C